MMKTTLYTLLVPLLALVAACRSGEPEQPEPVADRSATDAAQPADPMQEQPGAERAATAPPMAVAEISATDGFDAAGTVEFTTEGDSVRIKGALTGLKPGAHGLHIHEKGDCSAPDASSAGEHYSPGDDPHGSPQDLPDEHHLGDLGNVVAEEDGTAEIVAEDPEVRLSGPDSVVGKAVIVHEGRDDLESQPSGDSGARVGCGVIRMASQSAETGRGTTATAMTGDERAANAGGDNPD